MTNTQTVLVLVGIPGSGKTTLADFFQQNGWICINQDTLGSCEACEVSLERELLAGNNIVIDRCNHTRDQRKRFVLVVQQGMRASPGKVINLVAFVLETPLEVCIKRAHNILRHATLDPDEVVGVCRRFFGEFQRVNRAQEGFQWVYVARSDTDPLSIAHTILTDSHRKPPMIMTAQKKSSTNILPFNHRGYSTIPVVREVVVDLEDSRPILLFDLNGTLTSHTSKRRSAGRNCPRPGTHHLRRLQSHFQLGIFTSATLRTAETAIAMLEEHAGKGAPLFGNRSLVLYREHTSPAGKDHIDGGGKPWDTIKPLAKHFSVCIHRVLLFDDDAFKSDKDEENNMVVVPCWKDEDTEDRAVQVMVDVLLETLVNVDSSADLRLYTGVLSKCIHSRVQQLSPSLIKAAADITLHDN